MPAIVLLRHQLGDCTNFVWLWNARNQQRILPDRPHSANKCTYSRVLSQNACIWRTNHQLSAFYKIAVYNQGIRRIYIRLRVGIVESYTEERLEDNCRLGSEDVLKCFREKSSINLCFLCIFSFPTTLWKRLTSPCFMRRVSRRNVSRLRHWKILNANTWTTSRWSTSTYRNVH